MNSGAVPPRSVSVWIGEIFHTVVFRRRAPPRSRGRTPGLVPSAITKPVEGDCRVPGGCDDLRGPPRPVEGRITGVSVNWGARGFRRRRGRTPGLPPRLPRRGQVCIVDSRPSTRRRPRAARRSGSRPGPRAARRPLAQDLQDRPLRCLPRAGLGWFLRAFGSLALLGGACRTCRRRVSTAAEESAHGLQAPAGDVRAKRPDWQAWRRVWGRGPARGLRRVVGCCFGGQHPPPEAAEHSVQVLGLL